MSRNLDATLAAALPGGGIMPVLLAQIQFKSGVSYVWSGVGDLVYGGNTYKGVGSLGKVSPIVEGVDVRADGITVALSGLSAVALAGTSTPPAGLTPPVTIPPGQFVAWSTPTSVATADSCPSIGSVNANLDAASMNLTGTCAPGVSATWSGFSVPKLPADAVIVALYPTAIVDATAGPAFPLNSFGAPNTPESMPYGGQYSAASLGTTLADLTSASLSANLQKSLGGPSFNQSLGVTSPAIAIYYTSATNLYSVINEALGDIQLGAPAKIWFGLMQNGALVGTPYVIFAGLVDQPNIDTGVDETEISLALENRLSDLSRPSARRYTAADQHLKYPDDTGFNWVEILNDEALRWGS